MRTRFNIPDALRVNASDHHVQVPVVGLESVSEATAAHSRSPPTKHSSGTKNHSNAEATATSTPQLRVSTSIAQLWGLSPTLSRQHPENFVDVHSNDAERNGIEDGDTVTLPVAARQDPRENAGRRGHQGGRCLDDPEPATIEGSAHFSDRFARDCYRSSIPLVSTLSPRVHRPLASLWRRPRRR